MNARFFLDTNIFVYSFDENSTAKARQASKLVRTAVETGKGVVSYQVVQEFLNVAMKRFASPMSAPEAAQYVTAILRPLWTVHSSPALFGEALRICDEHRLAWYDSLIVSAALESECEILYSEDLQHGRRFGSLQIQNPFQ
jgi:predicted nucleic acid-binding protein